MLRIIDIQVSGSAAGEWVVIQNHGMIAVNLRGFMVCGDSYLSGNPESAAQQMFIFTADETIKPGARVALLSSYGKDGWQPTNEGGTAFVAYANRAESLWSHADKLHLLQPISSHSIHPGQILELVEREV
jgi:hypothetical protein